jgi:hypothetical protein
MAVSLHSIDVIPHLSPTRAALLSEILQDLREIATHLSCNTHKAAAACFEAETSQDSG